MKDATSNKTTEDLGQEQASEIDTEYMLNLLERLLEIPSPGGMTARIVEVVREECETLGLICEETRSGALKSRLGPAPDETSHDNTLAFAAHLDTLGAMVTRVLPNGRVALSPIGSLPPRLVEGARATLHATHDISGTILPLKASGHVHYEEINTQPVCWENLELRLDLRSENADETRQAGVEIGDIVSLYPQAEFLENGFVVARFLDNKAGVAILLAAAKSLMDRGQRPSRPVQFLFCIAEEVGGGSAHMVDPTATDFIALDIALCAEGQNSDPYGVTVAFKDLFGPYHRELSLSLIDICKRHDISHSRDVFPQYYSDARAVHEAGHDVRMALLGFACDSSHGYERTHLNSMSAASRLCMHAMTEL